MITTSAGTTPILEPTTSTVKVEAPARALGKNFQKIFFQKTIDKYGNL